MLRGALILTVALVLAGCGTRLNPFNWFGGDREEPVIAVVAPTIDPRPLVAEIVSLDADRVDGGAMVRVMGRADRQGYWQADLVETGRENGRLLLEFRVVPPRDATAEGTPQSREILTGIFLSAQALDGIREISVQGATNRRSVRR